MIIITLLIMSKIITSVTTMTQHRRNKIIRVTIFIIIMSWRLRVGEGMEEEDREIMMNKTLELKKNSCRNETEKLCQFLC
jgi:hypothetical protein